MLGYALAFVALLLTGTHALSQSFVLDMGNIDVAVPDLSAPLANTTSHTFYWPKTLQTARTSTTSATANRSAQILTITAAATLNNTRLTLPTTTVVVTLPNPTPRPGSSFEHTDGTAPLTDYNTERLDTSTAEPIPNWSHWFTAATFTLVFYDILTLGIFLWLWVFGYFWWFRWGRDGRNRARDRRGVGGAREMWRMDVPGRHGNGRESVWARSTRYGRVRSESEQRARRMREAEFEDEMRRLGMI